MSIEIIAAECLFPSGPTIALADIAVNTQFAVVRKHPFYTDRCGVRIKASYFPVIESMGITRWEIMLRELLSNLKRQLAMLPVPDTCRLWILLPEVGRAGLPDGLEALFIACAKDIYPNWADIYTLHGGHAQTGLALNGIIAKQNSQQEDRQLVFDVVIGCESYLATETLCQLESQKLIHNSYSFDSGQATPNAYGFIPGEGAAAVVFSSGFSKGCRLLAAATDREDHLRGMDSPCTGVGLANAAGQALRGLPSNLITTVITDLNGEPYRADEYGFVMTRLHAFLPTEHYSTVLPALATGDLGCVSQLMHIALTAHRYLQSKADNNQHSLILSSSLDTLRSAVVLGKSNAVCD